MDGGVEVGGFRPAAVVEDEDFVVEEGGPCAESAGVEIDVGRGLHFPAARMRALLSLQLPDEMVDVERGERM